MFGFGKARKIEGAMADWLAHPMEFGVRPKSVRFRHTHRAKLVTYGPVEIHVVDYEMPDGTKGRGFVNGSLTWSFTGEEVNAIADQDHFVAYCGWAWLFPAIQAKTVQTDFISEGEEDRLTGAVSAAGMADLRITGRYKIGSSELFEYSGTRDGIALKGAGDGERQVEFDATHPCFFLPPNYFFLGREVILER